MKAVSSLKLSPPLVLLINLPVALSQAIISRALNGFAPNIAFSVLPKLRPPMPADKPDKRGWVMVGLPDAGLLIETILMVLRSKTGTIME